MADITPTQLNAAIGNTVFADDGAGNAVLNLSTLTGDTVGMNSNLNEAVLKLLKSCYLTAEAEYTADNANDARSTYPSPVLTPTTAEGAPILRHTYTVVGKVAISDSLDSVEAL